ncbi:DUF1214 domain-containing protein [Agromyces sp. M3QZ16-3]|uniref:DUF1214 domain-containing protein n=1 Tax=Agromyces sp. M3QZ16-3 TaxID=3447585 RepID=UPI003F69163B
MHRRNGVRTRLTRTVALAASAAVALVLAIAAPAAAAPPSGNNGGKDIASTTENYLTTFYPIWFTHFQTTALPVPVNHFIGPSTISPIYQAVVAINDDTLYASTPLDVGDTPVGVYVPATPVAYSVLLVDPYGNVYPSGIPSRKAGEGTESIEYALIGPGASDDLLGANVVRLPLEHMIMIFRVDKHIGTDDVTDEANTFRTGILVDGVPTAIKPVEEFGVPVKTIADDLVRVAPIDFLRQMQVAVADDGWTPPLTRQEQKLSDDFDALFGDGSSLTSAERAQFARGARSAHDALIANYLDSRGSTNWTHFTNIGAWKKNVLDRASITEFCQYCNTIETAAYYHAFFDGNGAPLDGSNANGYVLTFPADAIPDAERFWSLTAYTPQAIQPIPNELDKYVVASYTEGLETNPDGSISIYMSVTQPDGVPVANWLPVRDGAFNVMLRVYGVVPKSDIAKDKYLPPAIQLR